MTRSRDGRRVIVALVTGDAGARIQAWRQEFDPDQARRIPPHATLAYWATVDPGAEAALDAQVRHAFPEQIQVRLGEVHEFDNADRTRYVDISNAGALDAARARLFNGRHVTFPEQRHAWDWHVTVVRYGRTVDIDEIRANADTLALHTPWTVDTIAWLELRGGVYHELRRWQLDVARTRDHH